MEVETERRVGMDEAPLRTVVLSLLRQDSFTRVHEIFVTLGVLAGSPTTSFQLKKAPWAANEPRLQTMNEKTTTRICALQKRSYLQSSLL